MKIAVWNTGHEIADTVAEAVYDGIKWHTECRRYNTRTDIAEPLKEDVHIAYGILRGTSEVFKLAQAMGKPWIHIDKGYWKPGHYDGYYRVSLCGTQQTFGLDKLDPDYKRWDALGIEVLPLKERLSEKPLICEPTLHVEEFFGGMIGDWWIKQCYTNPDFNNIYINRPKNCDRPLQNDLDNCSKVITFNSSVGWEALRQGIPVVSDPTHSIVGAYQKLVDKPLHADLDSRRRLFGIQAGLQLRLDEIRDGQLWPLLHKLLSLQSHSTSISDGIAVKA